MAENKKLVMVGLLIDSLRNLNPLLSRGGTWHGTPSGEQGDYLKAPGRNMSQHSLWLYFVPFYNF